MTSIEKYTIFLIEQYRSKFGISANSTYNLFKEKRIFEYINDTFEAIHTLDTDFVISEIEGLANAHKSCISANVQGGERSGQRRR